nr:hypothetical protein [Tanacetum cinerariifolium]
IVMDNPNSPNKSNEDILEENPVIPKQNHVEDAYDPNEMVDILDDEDLVDYDGDDEEPEEEPKQQIRHGNQFAQYPNPQPGNMNGWLEEDDDWDDDVERLMAPVTPPRATVADSIAIGEIHPRVATVGEQIQVMESYAVQVVSGLKEIKTRVQQVKSRVETYSSGQMAVPGQDEIIGLSQQ